MIRFVNRTSTMKVVEFEDGSAQFLMRGQSIITDKPVKRYDQELTATPVEAKASPKKGGKK